MDNVATNFTDVKRGDIFFVYSSGKEVGNEYKKGRPALVVSSDIQLKTSNYIQVVYLTTKPKKPLPTHFYLKVKSCNGAFNNGLYEDSTILCENITSIDASRLGKYICSLEPSEMSVIDSKLLIGLGLFQHPQSKSAEVSVLNEKLEDTENTYKKEIMELKNTIAGLKGEISVLDNDLNKYKSFISTISYMLQGL